MLGAASRVLQSQPGVEMRSGFVGAPQGRGVHAVTLSHGSQTVGSQAGTGEGEGEVCMGQGKGQVPGPGKKSGS